MHEEGVHSHGSLMSQLSGALTLSEHPHRAGFGMQFLRGYYIDALCAELMSGRRLDSCRRHDRAR